MFFSIIYFEIFGCFSFPPDVILTCRLIVQLVLYGYINKTKNTLHSTHYSLLTKINFSHRITKHALSGCLATL